MPDLCTVLIIEIKLMCFKCFINCVDDDQIMIVTSICNLMVIEIP